MMKGYGVVLSTFKICKYENAEIYDISMQMDFLVG